MSKQLTRKTVNLLLCGGIVLIVVTVFLSWRYGLFATVETTRSGDGTKMKFRTHGEQIEIYKEDKWQQLFLQGVNMGAALPGHYPGEFAMDRETYLRWFKMISEMGSNIVRVYTIHPPRFYSALVEYNKRNPKHPLYLIQGVYTPEENLIEIQDAYDPEIRGQFRQEISNAVGAVYGKITIQPQPGTASGKYTANAGPYLAAWHIGTEWDPQMVMNTNERHKDMELYEGKHFRVKEGASAFESWLAEMIDLAAEREREYGWEHPMTFTNWVTTDPLKHPGEPTYEEDMATVDATLIEPTRWEAGYFASYHVYPYYPDLFRFDQSLRSVLNKEGKPDPYKTYLRRLKEYHSGMPIIVAEFSVPSSWGIGHIEHLGRTQGGHNETGQGKVNAALFREIVEESYAGAILFSWQDEWFKKSWNTMRFEVPDDRRAFWLNVLTNEQMFGVLGMYPSKEGVLTIDGRKDDWDKLDSHNKQRMDFSNPSVSEMWVTHDEAYVYVLVNLADDFDPKEHTLYIGADTLPGGNKHAQQLAGATLDEGLETLIVLGRDGESEVMIASNYDFHTRLYGGQYRMLPYSGIEMNDNSGVFKPWKLAVGLQMNTPDTKVNHPFEDVPAGILIRGTSAPGQRDYNSMASWQRNGKVVEMRIPWMLLGFSDPSTHQAISYRGMNRQDKSFGSENSQGIRFMPWMKEKTQQAGVWLEHEVSPFPVSKLPMYQWEEWHGVNYKERKKQSYYIMQKVFIENLDN